MANISEENKEIAVKLASVLGGKPSVNRYWDEAEKSFVDLVACVDQPCDGVTSFGTIGLSDHPLVQDGKEFSVRLELVGASASLYTDFPNILTTAALYIINEKWFCCPGAVLQNAVDMYDNSLYMKHLMFVSPFLWDELKTTQYESKAVTWLLAVPISENERQYAENNGTDALEELFEKHQIDIYNLSRKSVL
jgi:hypothetical protein